MLKHTGKIRARKWQAQHRRRYLFRIVNGLVIDRTMFYFTGGM